MPALNRFRQVLSPNRGSPRPLKVRSLYDLNIQSKIIYTV
ncbi:unnamed protein product [Spirodela intermedia]|uniref:Uncharacterized protein n=1 Tax=Spirodela intermedia TaxID=51605 RepID=A0ABN7EBE9_SPIIN|nr:unnamed protein product [Spirodela intermedia]